MLLVLDPDSDFHDRMVSLAADNGLRTEPLRATSRSELESVVASGTVPGAVVIGPNVELPTATAVCTWLQGVAPGTAPLLVALPTTATLRAALRAGFRDVVAPTCTAKEFGEALRAAGYDERRVDHARDGQTVAVFSAKGGVGSSVLASNLAVRLRAATGVDCILADLDLTSADQAVLHGLRPSWTVQEIADGVVGDDVDAVEQVLLPIPRTGVRLLAGPTDPATAERIGDSAVVTLLQRLREIAPLVVVDTSSTFSDATLAVLEHADVVVLVVSLDVLSLRSLSVTLQTFDRLGIARHAVRVVVMRAGAKVGLSIDDVARATGGTVDVAIPSSRQVATSVNTGVPLAVDNPRSKVVRAVDELVTSVIEDAVIDGYDGPASMSRRRLRRAGRQRTASPDTAGQTPTVVATDGAPATDPAPPRPRRVVRVVAAAGDATGDERPEEVVAFEDESSPTDGLSALPPPTVDSRPAGANGSTRRKRRRAGRN